VSIGLQRGAVAVEAHKAEWETAAQKTIELLKYILKNDAVDIRHVGSTAVKNICAKSIIDIAVGVTSFEDMFRHNDELEKHGIAYRREDHPGQHLYVCADEKNNVQTHYIHVVLWNGEDWNNYVNLCDYLNFNEVAAQEYSRLKMRLAAEYPNSRTAYTNGKKQFIENALKQAKIYKNSKI
jgi:GrpB-like predicted nucleotidyltransferase (UPF0157 family)